MDAAASRGVMHWIRGSGSCTCRELVMDLSCTCRMPALVTRRIAGLRCPLVAAASNLDYKLRVCGPAGIEGAVRSCAPASRPRSAGRGALAGASGYRTNWFALRGCRRQDRSLALTGGVRDEGG
jgi:hypothetical protein